MAAGDPNFTSLVRPPPEIPRLNVTVAVDDGRTMVMPGAKAPLPTITAADAEPELEDADAD